MGIVACHMSQALYLVLLNGPLVADVMALSYACLTQVTFEVGNAIQFAVHHVVLAASLLVWVTCTYKILQVYEEDVL
jgi:hypothetical protein